MYNGDDWRPRPEGIQRLDPKGVLKTGFYEMPGQDDLRPGIDTRQGPLQPWNGTWTGYSLRKFLDRGLSALDNAFATPWPHLRYAEVLLNKAEASANLGDTQGGACLRRIPVFRRASLDDRG